MKEKPNAAKGIKVAYDRRLRPRKEGGDIRARMGATFFPPRGFEEGARGNPLEVEPKPHMSPSCPRLFQGDLITDRGQVQWVATDNNG